MSNSPQKSLYEKDFHTWLEHTVAKLKQHHFEEIDLDYLIEEVEGLAKRDQRELKNRLRVLLAHLLKRTYVQSPNDYRGWELTINEQRLQIQDLLEESPSLAAYIEEQLPQLWQQALATVHKEYPALELPNWQHQDDIHSLLQESFW